MTVAFLYSVVVSHKVVVFHPYETLTLVLVTVLAAQVPGVEIETVGYFDEVVGTVAYPDEEVGTVAYPDDEVGTVA